MTEPRILERQALKSQFRACTLSERIEFAKAAEISARIPAQPLRPMPVLKRGGISLELCDPGWGTRAQMRRRSTGEGLRPSRDLVLGDFTILEPAARQSYVSSRRVTRDPTTFLAPIPIVVRQVGAEDAIEQIVEQLVRNA